MAKYDEIVKPIRFPSNITKIEPKIQLVSKLDEALKKSGDLGVYGDLSNGIEDLIKDFRITITENISGYFIDCGPLSGSGHDFQFVLKKKNWSIDENSICVGEVLSEPDEEELDE